MDTSSTTTAQVFRKVRSIGFILAFGSFLLPIRATEPPPSLAKKVAERETETRKARDHYTYRQTMVVEELSPRGAKVGEYREVREVIFSPEGERSERVIGKPLSTLRRLKLTEEDFRDVREVQPFLFDAEQLWFYRTRFRGEETMEGVDCWVLQVQPKQILAGQRLFEGMLWVNKKDLSVVRSEGQAVPQMRSMKEENLFPRFTTIWERVEGGYWFPIHTYADDTLDFRVGPQRIRLVIRYSDYKRFGAESTVKFGPELK
jgi:hypothetical protein